MNRVDGDDKEYGYIVDYQNLFECISGAIGDYTSDGAALSGYDKEDIEGYIKEKNKACRKDLEEAKEQVEALLALVHPQTREGFFRYLSMMIMPRKRRWTSSWMIMRKSALSFISMCVAI